MFKIISRLKHPSGPIIHNNGVLQTKGFCVGYVYTPGKKTHFIGILCWCIILTVNESIYAVRLSRDFSQCTTDIKLSAFAKTSQGTRKINGAIIIYTFFYMKGNLYIHISSKLVKNSIQNIT